jgi:hypothetical protein
VLAGRLRPGLNATSDEFYQYLTKGIISFGHASAQ